MENDFDVETMRLKKLVDDSILKAEKETFDQICDGYSVSNAFLNSNECSEKNRKIPKRTSLNLPKQTLPKTLGKKSTNSFMKSSSAMKINNKSCSQLKSCLCDRHHDFENITDIHSNIHFLNSLEKSLFIDFKRRHLSNDAKNKYYPCAIPLSPPIRLKNEKALANKYSGTSKICYKCSKTETCPEKGIQTERNTQKSPIFDVSQKSFSGEIPKHFEIHKSNVKIPATETSRCKKLENYKLNVDEDMHKRTNFKSIEDYNNIHEKLEEIPCKFLKKYNMVEKTPSSESLQNCKLKIDNELPLLLNLKSFENDKAGVKCEMHEEVPSFKHFKTPIFSPHKREEIKSSKAEMIGSSHEVETSLKENFEQKGLNLQISLDSNSSKEIINKFLEKFSEFSPKNGTSVHTSVSHNSSPVKQDKDKINCFESGDFYNVANHSNLSVQKETTSTSIQTDHNMEDQFVRKHELQHMVEEITEKILTTLQTASFLTSISNKISPQKVDSGIQSEIETDVGYPENMPYKKLVLNESTKHPLQDVDISKEVQVFLEPICTETCQEPVLGNFCNSQQLYNIGKNCGLNNSTSFQTSQENIFQEEATYFKQGDTSILENETNKMKQKETNKIEMMVEKIYDHIFNKGEHNDPDLHISLNSPVITRDVAVQFNPLHTSTKSTHTLEIKTADSSCQYDILLENKSLLKQNIDASIQTFHETEAISADQVMHASTQYDPIAHLNVCTQTDMQHISEPSANVVSSTPVSDSMYIDDSLSEGEVPLPHNLRLSSDNTGGFSVSGTELSDASLKESDYSLSEGEIHPKLLHHLKRFYSNYPDRYDFLQNLSSRFANSSPKAPKCSCDTNIEKYDTDFDDNRQHSSSSVLSEGEIKITTLSPGEVVFGVQYAGPSNQ